MNLINELDKKRMKNDNEDALIGAEIKLRRNSLSKTLEAVSLDTCSISYLSKVENNEIKPNLKMLEDICERVSLTKDNLKLIIESKEVFGKVIKAFYQHDEDLLKEYYDKSLTMKNYRSKITKLFYLLYSNNNRAALRIFKELDKILSAIQLNDLIVLCYLRAYFHLKNNEIKEAYMILCKLLDDGFPYPFLEALVLELYVEILYITKSVFFLTAANQLKERYLEHCSYLKLKDVDLKILWFYLRCGAYRLLRRKLDLLECPDPDLRILLASVYKEEIDVSKATNDFVKMIYFYQTKQDMFKKMYEENKFKCDEKQTIILSILYTTKYEKDAYYETVRIYYPYLLAAKDQGLIDFATKILLDVIVVEKKYKRGIELILQTEKLKRECEDYC